MRDTHYWWLVLDLIWTGQGGKVGRREEGRWAFAENGEGIRWLEGDNVGLIFFGFATPPTLLYAACCAGICIASNAVCRALQHAAQLP